MRERDLRTGLPRQLDLTPEHRDKSTGVHGVGKGKVETESGSQEKVDTAVGELASYLAALIRTLSESGVLEGNLISADDDLDVETVLERLENMVQ